MDRPDVIRKPSYSNKRLRKLKRLIYVYQESDCFISVSRQRAATPAAATRSRLEASKQRRGQGAERRSRGTDEPGDRGVVSMSSRGTDEPGDHGVVSTLSLKMARVVMRSCTRAFDRLLYPQLGHR
jgi:hypothetical protein